MMTSKEYRRFTEVSCFCCEYVARPSFLLANYITYVQTLARVPSVSL